MGYDPLTPEQREIRDLVRALAHERIAPRAAEIDRTATFPADVLALFREHGVFGTLAGPEHGGIGTSSLAGLLAIEEVAKVCASSSTILCVQALGALALQLGGTQEQIDRLLPGIAAGDQLVAYALTEPEAGSDAAALRTSARREGDEYLLDGTKRFVTHAGVADLLFVFARTGEPGSHGVSAFVVDARAPGITVGRFEQKLGLRGSPTGELALEGVRVPAENRIGDEGTGFVLAMRIFDRSRPSVAAQAVGIAQGATDAAVAYAKERVTMGQPIGRHQLVAGMLARMDARTEAARGLVLRCGAMIDGGGDGPELTRLASIAKVVCSDVAMEVTTDAVQVFGGAGYTQDFPVERMMRDAKITQIYEGTNQIQQLVIARELMRRP